MSRPVTDYASAAEPSPGRPSRRTDGNIALTFHESEVACSTLYILPGTTPGTFSHFRRGWSPRHRREVNSRPNAARRMRRLSWVREEGRGRTQWSKIAVRRQLREPASLARP